MIKYMIEFNIITRILSQNRSLGVADFYNQKPMRSNGTAFQKKIAPVQIEDIIQIITLTGMFYVPYTHRSAWAILCLSESYTH